MDQGNCSVSAVCSAIGVFPIGGFTVHVHVVNKSELQRSKKDLLTARACLRFESKPRKWIRHARKKLLKIT